jgi:hypothetical protein
LGSPNSVCQQEVLLRYEIAFERRFNRALANLLALQSLPLVGKTVEENIYSAMNLGRELKTTGDTFQTAPKAKPGQSHRTLPPGELLTSGEAMVEIKG